jgi:hypothetical protein
MVMKKTCYIHSGHPKTGSSSLQLFCNENREYLHTQHNIYYPRSGCSIHFPSHIFLIPIKDSYWQLLLKEIREYPECNILLSAEGYMGKTPKTEEEQDALVRSMKDYLQEYQIKIIMYIRRFDDELKSAFNQQLKRGAVPSDALPADWGRCYEEMVKVKRSSKISNTILMGSVPANIAAWQRMFGKENVTIRLYERNILKNGNIIDDFFDTLGIEISGVPTDFEENPKAPEEALSLLSILFPMGGKPHDPIDSLLREKILNAYSPLRQGSTVGQGEEFDVIHEELIGIYDAIVPGYKSLFQERKCSFTIPPIDLEPKEIVKFDILFSLFYKNSENEKLLHELEIQFSDLKSSICELQREYSDIKSILMYFEKNNILLSNQLDNISFFINDIKNLTSIYLKKHEMLLSKLCIQLSDIQASLISLENIKDSLKTMQSEMARQLRALPAKCAKYATSSIIAAVKRFILFPSIAQRFILLLCTPVFKLLLPKDHYHHFRKQTADFISRPDKFSCHRLRRILAKFGKVPHMIPDKN